MRALGVVTRSPWVGTIGAALLAAAVMSCGANDATDNTCGPGTVLAGSACVPAPISCGPGTVLDGGVCSNISDAELITCGPGTVQAGSECVAAPSDAGAEAGSLECGPGTIPVANLCVPEGDGGALTCGPGTILSGTTCVPAGSTGQVVLANNVTVVDELKASKVTVTADSLLFPAQGNDDIAAKKQGDILVSGVGNGFLRKVQAIDVQSNEIVVQTEQASLEDAIQQGSFATVIDLGAALPSPGQTQLHSENASFTLGYDLSGTRLYEDPGAGVTVEISKGFVKFTPSLDIAGDLEWLKLRYFRCQAIGVFTTELAVKASAAHQYSKSLPVTLWEGQPQVFTQTIGAFPVVEVVRTRLEGGIDINMDVELSAEAGVGVQTTVRVGAEYANKTWKPIGSLAFDPYFTGPTFTAEAGASVTVWIRPVVEVFFYNVAGPWINLEPSITASGKFNALSEPPFSWSLDGRLQSHYGGKVQLLSNTLAGFDSVLFDKTVPFASSDKPDGGTPDAGLSCGWPKGDCNGLVSDGCESSLNLDTKNCGSCGHLCPDTNAVPSCNLGTCKFTCKTAFGDCNGNASDGCETSLHNEPLNCGSCGVVCTAGSHAVPVCNLGFCHSVCELGWADCSANLSDGCETDLVNSSQNCGGCGISCASGTCDKGVCAPVPDAGADAVSDAGPDAPSCVQAISCIPANPCHIGSTNCLADAAVCVDTGANVPDGTDCGTDGMCTSGACGAAPSVLSVEQGQDGSAYENQLLAPVILKLTQKSDNKPVIGATVKVSGPPGAVIQTGNGLTDLSGKVTVVLRNPPVAGQHVFSATSQNAHSAEIRTTAVVPPKGTITPLLNVDYASGTGFESGPAATMRPQAGVSSMAWATDGTLYFSTMVEDSCRILKVTPAGVVHIVAGVLGWGCSGGFGDYGPALEASLGQPSMLVIDEAQNRLLFRDLSIAYTVRAINLQSGLIETIAGGGSAPAPGYGDDGPATGAVISPIGMALGPDGALYMLDGHYRHIRRVDPITGVITHWFSETLDCTRPLGVGNPIQGPWFDQVGNAYFAASVCGTSLGLDDSTAVLGLVRRTPGGILEHVAGGPGTYPSANADGMPATGMNSYDESGGIQAWFVRPSGDVLFVDSRTTHGKLRRIDAATGLLSTVAGAIPNPSTVSGDFGPALNAGGNYFPIAEAPFGAISVGQGSGIRLIW